MNYIDKKLFDQGVLQLFGDLEYFNVAGLVSFLHQALQKPGKEFTVSICSPGGDFNLAIGLFDLIRWASRLGTRVNTVCFGEVSSGGILIAAAGDRIIALPNTSFCMHYVINDETKERDVPETLRYLRLIEERTKLRADHALEEIKKGDNNEWIFDAPTALSVGLITEIV